MHMSGFGLQVPTAFAIPQRLADTWQYSPPPHGL
jgi:hypothetical protein